MKKILLIEDQPAEGANMKEILALSNFTVVTAGNAADGIRTALTQRPDLIICDLAMPGSDVYTVLHALQHEPASRLVPVVVLTTESDKANVRRIMVSGADDCLIKPFEGIELLRSVEACLERRRRMADPPPAGSPLHATPASGPAQDNDPPWEPGHRVTRQYIKKAILYTEGQRASQVWYIVDGKIKTYLVHTDGKELITGIYGAGDCLGYAAAIRGGLHTDNARILEDADLVVIPRREFMQLLNSDSAFSRQLIRWLSRSVCQKDEDLLNLAYSSLRKKIANGILSLSGNMRRMEDGKPFITISRDNLASFVGSAPESLTRTLGDFRKEGLIDISGGRIWILNEDKLRRLLN